MDLDIHVDLVDTVVFVCSIDVLIHVGDTALLYWLVIQREAPYLKKSAIIYSLYIYIDIKIRYLLYIIYIYI